METVDNLRPEIARLIAAKQQRRHRLPALSFPEKVRIVVQLQRMAAPVLRARGRPVQVADVNKPRVIFASSVANHRQLFMHK